MTFFSGTDTSCLKEVAPCHNYFVSLIVNIKGDLACKIAVEGTKKYRTVIKKEDGSYGALSDIFEEKVTFIYNVDIEIENDLDSDIETYIAKNKLRSKPVLTHEQFDKPHHIKDRWDIDWRDFTPNKNQLALFQKEELSDNKPISFKDKVKSFLAKLITVDIHWTDTLDNAYIEAKQQLLHIKPDVYKEQVEENIDCIVDEVFDEELDKIYSDADISNMTETSMDINLYQDLVNEIHKEAESILSDSFKFKTLILYVIKKL